MPKIPIFAKLLDLICRFTFVFARLNRCSNAYDLYSDADKRERDFRESLWGSRYQRALNSTVAYKQCCLELSKSLYEYLDFSIGISSIHYWIIKMGLISRRQTSFRYKRSKRVFEHFAKITFSGVTNMTNKENNNENFYFLMLKDFDITIGLK